MALTDVSTRPLTEIVSLAGRTAVVTGAAWGLGKATARRLAEAGASRDGSELAGFVCWITRGCAPHDHGR